MDEWIYEDINFLNDIYCLESLHFKNVQDDMKIRYLYETTGDPTVLMEGFNDIITNIGNFFSTMIEKIKEFSRKVFLRINSYLMDIDTFCTKYKPELDKITNVDFDIYGFEFTLHDEPNMEPFSKIVDDYNAGISDVLKMKLVDIVKQQNEYMADSNLDRLRGIVLGVNRSIHRDEYLEEIRRYYRNGEIDAVELHVDTTVFKNIIQGSPMLMNEKKEAERTRDNLIKLLQKTETFFNKKVPLVYNSKGATNVELRRLNVSSDKKLSISDSEMKTISGSVEIIDRYVRFKYNQVRELSIMINMVATERANAYKDKVKMYKEIIQKALFQKTTVVDTHGEV